MVRVQDIVVKQTAPDVFEVSVGGRSPTTHRVTAPEEYVRSLTGGRAPGIELLRKSFEFLLEREPNTSILRTFELSVIQQYFPEYEQIISAAFAE
jgi:hypothetical protein